MQEVVDPVGFVRLHFSCHCVSCSSEALQVLESGAAVAKGQDGRPGPDPVHPGVEDEGGQFRFEQRAAGREEIEELERGDQVEAAHLVLPL